MGLQSCTACWIYRTKQCPGCKHGDSIVCDECEDGSCFKSKEED